MRCHLLLPRLRAAAVLLTLAATIFAIGWPAAPSGAASGSTVVTASVVSSLSVTNECLASSARQFGIVPIGSGGATTATAAGQSCRVAFAGTGGAQLRVGQTDGQGRAMSLGMTAPERVSVSSPYTGAGRTIGVFGYDDQLAWAVGRADTVYRTTNGGAWWGGPTFLGFGHGTDVEMRPGNPDEWWLTAEDRRLWQTTNGRVPSHNDVTFTSHTSALGGTGWALSADINELSFANADTMVIVGEQANVAIRDFTTGTWSRSTPAAAGGGNIIAVDTRTASDWLAVTVAGRIMRTTDAGASWSYELAPGAPIALTDVAWGGANRAYVIGDDGYVAVWDGTSWVERSEQIAAPADLIGVDAVPGSPDTVLVTEERGGVYRSTDAGVSWSHRSSRGGSRQGDIHATTSTKAYTVAAERMWSDSDDGGLTWRKLAAPTNGPHMLQSVAVSPVDGKRLIAVGGYPTMSTDGGANWTMVSTGSGALFGVTLANDTRGWAVGDDARILRTDDFGATWDPQVPPAGVTARLNAVRAWSERQVVAVGNDGTILTTGTAGDSWNVRSVATTNSFVDLDNWDGDLFVAVGACGTIVRSLDAGSTWQVVADASVPDPNAQLIGVAVTSPTTAFAATSRGAIWRTTDAGATWTQLPGNPSMQARTIAAAEQTIILGGLDNRIARSSDGGMTFTTSVGPTTMHLVGSVAIDTHAAMLVGGDTNRLLTTADTGTDTEVADWALGSNDWDAGGFFAVCLQSATGDATAVWAADTTNSPGDCQPVVADPWRALPAVPTTAAQTATSSAGAIELVWGFNPKPTQLPGVYESTVTFAAIAP